MPKQQGKKCKKAGNVSSKTSTFRRSEVASTDSSLAVLIQKD